MGAEFKQEIEALVRESARVAKEEAERIKDHPELIFSEEYAQQQERKRLANQRIRKQLNEVNRQLERTGTCGETFEQLSEKLADLKSVAYKFQNKPTKREYSESKPP